MFNKIIQKIFTKFTTFKKFFKENTLVNQQFIKDSKLSISQYLKSHSDSAKVTGFSRVGLV